MKNVHAECSKSHLQVNYTLDKISKATATSADEICSSDIRDQAKFSYMSV